VLPEHADRDEVITGLKRQDIGTSVLYRPLHLHTAYRNLLGHRQGDFPVSEKIYARLVNLPVSPAIGEADIEYVIDTLRRLLSK
jgi:dTDP-4-amino-4,6-dideoxygalactose transaminase